MRTRGSEAITPTAHYTAHVWARNGLSHPDLATLQGRLMYEALRPTMTVSGALGGPTLEAYLLARHRAIDALLRRAVEQEGVTQVIELACGLSPRGWRFAGRYGKRITYVEADLPDMAERKRQALARIGSLGQRHRVEAVDVLRPEGAGSLAEVAETLDREAGLAVITEGLLGYLPRDVVESMWRRIAGELSTFKAGRYMSDMQLRGEAGLPMYAFRIALGAFVGGNVSLYHYAERREAEEALSDAGFARATVTRAIEVPGSGGKPATGGRLAHILFASTQR